MIRSIVDASLRFRVLVLGLAVAIFGVGYAQLREMPVDALPEFAPVYVEVQTESLGLSAVEVEQLITAPMEQMLLNGVPFLEDISSESIPGLSSIVLVFEPGTDPLEARQVVQERLSQGRDLPKVAKPPVMLQPLSSNSRVMMIRIDSDELSPIEQSVLARWTIKPALMGVTGVANVAIWGQREQQMQVRVDPERLRENGVSLAQVVTTSANALWVSPLSFVEASTPGTGGFIDTPNQRLGIQHILPITEPAHMANVALESPGGAPLRVGGKPVLLGDVVSIVEDHQPLIGDALAGESQGLMLVVEKFPEANPVEVTESVEETLDRLEPGLSGLQFDTRVFRPASYLDSAAGNLSWILLLALLLIAVALALIYDWRAAVIAAVTLPLSFVTAVLVLHLRGATMNVMLMAGLLVAAAALIDDAVLGLDRIRGPLRGEVDETRRRELVAAAVQNLRRPMVFATLIMLAATVPIFYVGLRDGLNAQFYWPIVLSYALALLASWVVVLTVAPVLASLLFRKHSGTGAGSPVGRRLDSSYRNLLTRGIGKPAPAVAVFGVVAVAGVLVTPFLDRDMRPHLNEETLLIHWEAAPGTSHPEMSRITARVAAELRDLPGIENVGAHVGRALTSDEVANVNSGEVWATLSDDADHDDTVASVQDIASGYPGIRGEVLTYTEERAAEHGIGEAPSSDVVVRVYGQEYDVLIEKAHEVREMLAGLDGAGEVAVASQPQEPEIEVKVDLSAAQEFGLTPGQVRRAAATLVSGIEVGNLFEQQKVFEVIVLGEPEVRHDLEVVRDLTIDSPGGRAVRLGDVAQVSVTSSPTAIRHDAVSRYVDVIMQVTGEPDDVADEAEDALEEFAFPLEYHAEILEDFEAEQALQTQVLGYALAALVAMFLLFQACLRSWRLALAAFVGLPLALSGGMILAAVTGLGLDLGALLGVLLLTGVYTRNLLGLFSLFRESAPHRGQRPDVALVVRGAQERFLPTFAVAVAIAVIFVPVLVMGPLAGLEVLHPMAVVVLGGLVTTTAMSLFFLPLLYLRTAPDDDALDFADHERRPDQPGVSAG
jgi:Cu/Ag efflux pump CusA